MFKAPMVTIELAEYQALQKQIEHLSTPSETQELSQIELQEATGLLLGRALDNPGLFRGSLTDVQLGKYKAIFAIPAFSTSEIRPTIRVKFVRT